MKSHKERDREIDELVAQRMVICLAELIDDHVESHVQNVFINRTGIARNRIFRIKEKIRNPDSTEEIRFSIPELLRIAREMRYSSLTSFIEDIEADALHGLEQHTDETSRRRKSIELAALFLKLSDGELQRIREALDLVTSTSG